jgi:hypothetical protein
MDSKLNGKATASLVLGVIGMFAWLIPLFGLPVNIVGLVFGVKGRGSEKPKFATAGIVLTIIGLVACVINASIGAFMGANGMLF